MRSEPVVGLAVTLSNEVFRVSALATESPRESSVLNRGTSSRIRPGMLESTFTEDMLVNPQHWQNEFEAR